MKSLEASGQFPYQKSPVEFPPCTSRKTLLESVCLGVWEGSCSESCQGTWYVFGGHIRILEKKMETTILGLYIVSGLEILNTRQ